MISSKLYTILFVEEMDSNDAIIAKYLINNGRNINKLKMNDVLEQVNVSKSTFSRFIKKLGYSNYAELRYALINEKSTTERIVEPFVASPIINELSSKKKFIVLGDPYSISPLLYYVEKFRDIGCCLDLKLSISNYEEMLDIKELEEDTVVLFVSLLKNDLELLLDYTNGYYLLTKKVSSYKEKFYYIGKESSDNEFDNKLIINQNEYRLSVSELLKVFDQLYLNVKRFKK